MAKELGAITCSWSGCGEREVRGGCVLRTRPLQLGRERCFTKDEGGPLGVGVQEQASNHLKLLGQEPSW